MTPRGKLNRRRSGRPARLSLTAVLRASLVALVLVIFAASGALLGLRAWRWASTDPRFAITDIEVVGTRSASGDEVLALSGLAPGQNLFRVSLKGVAKKIIAHPWVRRVEIARHFPSRVTISIEEHVPAAIVQLGDSYLVDSEGRPFKRWESIDAVSVPLVSGIDRDDYQRAPTQATQKLREALTIASHYARSDMAQAVPLTEVKLSDDAVSVVLDDGKLEARLSLGALEPQLQNLSKVWSELSRRGLHAEVIRLDNRVRPGWVAVRLEPAELLEVTSK